VVTHMLFNKLRVILSARGVSDAGGFVLVDDGVTGPRIQSWDAGRLGPQPTEAEINAVSTEAALAAAPRPIDNRELMRRLSAEEHHGLETLSRTDAMVCKLWNTLKAGGQADVQGVEFRSGVAYLRTVAVPGVWADLAAFDGRMAAITA
jgi:hypothetical protein